MLDPEDLKYFEDMITEKRNAIMVQLQKDEGTLRDSTQKESSGDLSAYSVHMPDQGSDAISREMSYLFASRDEKYVKHLDEALRRIEDGTFGICRTCGQAISKARLEAVPNATECIGCKSQRQPGE